VAREGRLPFHLYHQLPNLETKHRVYLSEDEVVMGSMVKYEDNAMNIHEPSRCVNIAKERRREASQSDRE